MSRNRTTKKSSAEAPEGAAAVHFTDAELLIHETRLFMALGTAADPGERPPVDAWAEGNLVLSRRVTRFDGPLRLALTPYVRGILQAFSCGRWQRIALVWAAQTGKTLVLQIIVGYCVDQDPGPLLVVYPQRDTAKRRSRKHLRTLIEDSPVLAKHVPEGADNLQLFEYSLDTMTINIGWAGSSAMLASEPVRYLVRDEFAKYKHLDRSEGHPMELAARRVTSYGEIARIVDATTPALKGQYGDRDLNGGTFHEYWVPCPECGKPGAVADVPHLVEDVGPGGVGELTRRLAAAGYQVMRWGNVKGWGDERDPEKVKKLAYYSCEHCGAKIVDKAKRWMTAAERGKWVPRHPDREEFSSWLPSWYRDTSLTTFGAVAGRFVAAMDDPRKLQDWVNSDCAEGWEEMGVARSSDDILDHRRDYVAGAIPFEPLAIVMTVDVRDPELHYVVRAWGEHETSAQLRYGVIARLGDKPAEGEEATGQSLAALDPYLALTFRGPGDREWGIDLTIIDSGHDTDEVYAYCRTRPRCMASKGEDGMRQIVKYTQPIKTPGSNDAAPDSPWLVSFQTDYFKDALMAKLAVKHDLPGEWMLHGETGDDFVHHMTAEKKVEVRGRYGRVVFRWKQFSKANHWFDCEVAQVVGARFLGVRDMHPPPPPDPAELPAEPDRREFLGRDVSEFANRFRR